MCMNNIIDVSKVSLIKKRDSINFVYFKKICNEILNFIYKDHDKQRIIGVDGTYIPLSIELKKYGFTTSNKNTYCIGLVSSLFDLNDEVLINYRLCKNHNEREGLLKQIKYLRSGDTLIMDRGYYSKNLLFLLNKMKIKVIFRMTINNLMIKKIIEKGQTSMNIIIVYNNESIKFRIITYQINGKNYFLGTTIMNHKVNYFKNLYWKRWKVEINFRESKYVLSLNNISSKNENKVRQDIYIHNILFLLNSFVKNHIQKGLSNDKFINSKDSFHLIVNNILYLILYKKMTVSTINKIKKICLCLLKAPIKNVPDRNYKRVRIKPIDKWYYCIKHEEKNIY
jgi:hypothetical protein